jgi:hypothetical protein
MLKIIHISAVTVVGILRVNMLVRKPHTGQAVGSKWDVMDLIGTAGERAAIQLTSDLRKFNSGSKI